MTAALNLHLLFVHKPLYFIAHFLVFLHVQLFMPFEKLLMRRHYRNSILKNSRKCFCLYTTILYYIGMVGKSHHLVLKCLNQTSVVVLVLGEAQFKVTEGPWSSHTWLNPFHKMVMGEMGGRLCIGICLPVEKQDINLINYNKV